MSRRPVVPGLLAAALLTLVVGGAVIGSGIRGQHDARGDLNELRVANENLELVLQARIDEARGQQSLAFTPAGDDALAKHVDYLRELAPNDAAAGLERLTELDQELQRSQDQTPLLSISLALNQLADDTTSAVIDRQHAAEARTWWAFWLTGAAAVVLLAVSLALLLRRP